MKSKNKFDSILHTAADLLKSLLMVLIARKCSAGSCHSQTSAKMLVEPVAFNRLFQCRTVLSCVRLYCTFLTILCARWSDNIGGNYAKHWPLGTTSDTDLLFFFLNLNCWLKFTWLQRRYHINWLQTNHNMARPYNATISLIRSGMARVPTMSKYLTRV